MPAAPAVVRFHNGRPLSLEGGHGFRIPCHEHRSAGSMVQPMRAWLLAEALWSVPRVHWCSRPRPWVDIPASFNTTAWSSS